MLNKRVVGGVGVFIYSIRAFKHSSIVSIVSIARSASTQATRKTRIRCNLFNEM